MYSAGIYIDAENIRINGGYHFSFQALKDFVESEGFKVMRSNCYLALDTRLEESDQVVSAKREAFRRNLRRYGYKVIPKTVKRFVDEDGREWQKSNTDMEMAIDALQEADKLDRVVLVTGDSDFRRLVEAIQNKGVRVDALAFRNYGHELVETVDQFYVGYLIKGLLPMIDKKTHRGFIRSWNFDRGFGFLTNWSNPNEEGYFIHVKDFPFPFSVVEPILTKMINNEHFVFEYELVEVDNNGENKMRVKNPLLVATRDASLKQYLTKE